MKFIITIDTEADNQWRQDGVLSLKNIYYLARLQKLCDQYNFPVTYLVTYEVANDENASFLLKKFQQESKSEIGAHLHPWSTPPNYEFEKDGKVQVFPSELDDNSLKLKLTNLTEKITEVFGQKPESFRAGRWGFDERLVKYLLYLGYKVDCSITPKISWINFKGLASGKGGPDFRLATVYPYYLSEQDICQIGQSKLLEVPMTILYTGSLIREGGALAKKFVLMPNSIVKKVLNKLFFRLKWARIFPETTIYDLKEMCYCARKNNLPAIEFMIHSSELMPGGSPYAKDEKAVEKIYKNLEYFFRYLKDNKVEGITLGEFARNFKK